MFKINTSILLLLFTLSAFGQQDSLLNMDAVHNRPLSQFGASPVSLGGYLETNWQHLGTDGVSEGHQLQARRLTLFVSSSLRDNMKFLTEIEFEEGGKEINIEFASLDIRFHPLLNLRSGIIMNPIGAFNQNHDGPKWEFTDRPIMSNQLLPATWSNAGVGLFGKYYKSAWMFGYEAYVSGGFDGSIIDNEMGKTYLPAAKGNAERFEEGPLNASFKLAIAHDKFGELGLSTLFGKYQLAFADGLMVSEDLGLNIFAIDYNKTFGFGTKIIAEYANIAVDRPAGLAVQYAEKQEGLYVDIIQPIFKSVKIGPWKESTINLACRFEYVDWNKDLNFGSGENNGSLTPAVPTTLTFGEHVRSIMPAISLRPSDNTVLRLNYRYMQQTDFVRNPASNTGGFSLGFSSYF